MPLRCLRAGWRVAQGAYSGGLIGKATEGENSDMEMLSGLSDVIRFILDLGPFILSLRERTAGYVVRS